LLLILPVLLLPCPIPVHSVAQPLAPLHSFISACPQASPYLNVLVLSTHACFLRKICSCNPVPHKREYFDISIFIHLSIDLLFLNISVLDYLYIHNRTYSSKMYFFHDLFRFSMLMYIFKFFF
jgi:hypothetical protein